jgi:uncharacterized protein
MMTDALSSVIISSAIIPRFKSNDISGGIERGVDGIISVLSGDTADWQPKKVDVRADDPSRLFDGLFPILLFIAIILIMRYLIGTAGGGGQGGGPGRYVRRGGRSVFIPYGGGSWGGSSDWGGGSSGGFGGGFDGGGFGGGGGSSGGGGASGGW